MAAQGRGGEKEEEKEKKEKYYPHEDSTTLSQIINSLLLKAQIERLNSVPPHFRNP